MSPDITLILIQTENFCASLHARRDAGRVINKFVLMRKYFCIMSLMVTGCHHVSMPPHNCSHTNNSPTITLNLSKNTEPHVCSDENGLYLVLGQVHSDGPAYESGLRSGDVIVTVSE